MRGVSEGTGGIPERVSIRRKPVIGSYLQDLLASQLKID